MYKLINIDTSHHCKNRDDNFFWKVDQRSAFFSVKFFLTPWKGQNANSGHKIKISELINP